MRPIEWHAEDPRRCPNCRRITDQRVRNRWAVVMCCRCGARFTRFPKIARILPKLGVVCEIHRNTRRWK